MKRNGLFTLFTVLTLGILITGIYWLVTNLERVPENYRTEANVQVLRNPFYTAERFLSRQGLVVESQSGSRLLKQLPSPQDIVIIDRFDQTLTPTQFEQLEAWLKAGGTLLTSAKSLSVYDEQETPDKAGAIRKEEASGKESIQFNKKYPLEKLGLYRVAPKDKEAMIVELRTSPTYRIAFDTYVRLLDTQNLANYVISDPAGKMFLDLPIGKGHIMVASSLEFMSNPEIESEAKLKNNKEKKEGEEVSSVPQNASEAKSDKIESYDLSALDHAYFLWSIVTQNGKYRPHKIWLAHEVESPNLLTLIWDRAPYACVAFLGLLTTLIAYLIWAYGPRYPQQSQTRRNILEHIAMIGQYAWRYDRTATLMHKNRQKLYEDLLRRFPQFRETHTPAERVALSEVLSQAIEPPNTITAEEIYQALFDESQLQEKTLVHYTQTMQILQNYLKPSQKTVN